MSQASCHTLYTFYLRLVVFFFFSSRRRHTRLQGDWSSDVCSSDLFGKSILSGIYVAMFFSIIWTQGFKVVLRICGILFIGFNVYAITHYHLRSEERRVGKECRSRWSPYH